MPTIEEWAVRLRHTSADYPLKLRETIEKHNEQVIRLVFKAGQEAMRERAAICADAFGGEKQLDYGLDRGVQDLFRARERIRALPIQEEA